MVHHYLACDLGAASGRVMSGRLENGVLTLEELHRFPTPTLPGPCWNFPRLVNEVHAGVAKAMSRPERFESISTDAWGVDYVFFNQRGEPLAPVYHYRHPRTKNGVERAYSRVRWPKIFEETGIQFMPINTLFQLCAEDPARLRAAAFLLGIGDALNYLLCGVPKMEVSNASTFQLYNPRSRSWSEELISALDLHRALFPEIVSSGTRLGEIREGLQVIATCSHDTGAAVAGVPARGEGWAYLSSGTWSLMGVELVEPIINDAARELNFTNEIGYGGTVRLLKNLSGLWLIQECRREWFEAGKEFDYPQLIGEAGAAEPFRSLINPAAEDFLAPASMCEAMANFCRRTGQPVPDSEAAYIRCALESLALLYRRTLGQLRALTGKPIDRLHVVGGGSQNDLLNQFTADALELPVHAGPVEATALGNIAIQAITLEHISSLAEAREIIRRSTTMRTFQPQNTAAWDRAAERFDLL